jgi:hypothetical protein
MASHPEPEAPEHDLSERKRLADQIICHDLNPRAMSKRVLNFHPARSWSRDFTQITMA